MVTSIECDNCGASLGPDTLTCGYCGSALQRSDPHHGKPPIQATSHFGFVGPVYHLVLLGILVILYGLGWLLEDTHYWLDTRAWIVWCGAIPLWLFFGALFRRSPLAPILLGVAICIALTAGHLAVMALMRDSINDDMVAIASLPGAAALAGWLAGRFVRHRICRGPMTRQTPEET